MTRGVFLGCTIFSAKILETILKIEGFDLVAIFTIPEDFTISYSKKSVKNINYSDLSPYAERLKIPIHTVDGTKGNGLINYYQEICDLKPDVILAMGWYYMVPKKIRCICRHGVWGIHASMLPKYAGGAPLVWTIINGEKATGVTLFRLADGVDNGDIIAQESFLIEDSDTIVEVYDKAVAASRIILKNCLVNIDSTRYVKQDQSKIEVYAQRSPKDGEIDWSWDSKRIKNFIRAQTKPYPGAWTIINGRKVTIWDAEIE